MYISLWLTKTMNIKLRNSQKNKAIDQNIVDVARAPCTTTPAPFSLLNPLS